MFFKSNRRRYFLRGISLRIIPDLEVTYGVYTRVSLFLAWLRNEMLYHPNISNLFITQDVRNIEVGCKLPMHIQYGRFKLVLGEAFRPGAWVPTGTRILLTCIADVDGTSISTHCNLDEWQPPIHQLECKRPGKYAYNFLTNQGYSEFAAKKRKKFKLIRNTKKISWVATNSIYI